MLSAVLINVMFLITKLHTIFLTVHFNFAFNVGFSFDEKVKRCIEVCSNGLIYSDLLTLLTKIAFKIIKV